jgi:8-oxo-dGTP pyrophosphatase MutT (NUDIX family)
VTTSKLTPERISALLEAASLKQPVIDYEFPPELLDAPPKPAAVLIPLQRTGDAWFVVFIRRTDGMVEHSGQVAFPGGRVDPEDINPTMTALREAQEEIGLAPQDARILGRLPDYLTVTNYLVTPIVAEVPWPYSFIPAEVEVARIFRIPLDWLADTTHSEERLRELPAPFGPLGVVYFQVYDGEILWGASAKMMRRFLSVLNSF